MRRAARARAGARARGAPRRRGAARVAAGHRGRGDVRRVRHARSTSPTRPVANQERAFIREQIAAGKDKTQIKAALVDEYGAGRARRARGATASTRRCGSSRSCSSLLAALGIGVALRALAPAPRRRAERRAAAAADARAPRTPGGSTRSSPASTDDRRRRHHGHRRVRGRLRLVHLALRAAARARLPVGGLGRLARRDAAGRAQPVADPAARRSSSACRSPSSSSRSG